MGFQTLFYRDERGREPVRELLQSLPIKTRAKIGSWIAHLENEGPFLRRPYADKLTGKLYELRIRFSTDHIRILYYFFLKDKIILLHAFRKKDWAIDRRDLEMAERRMNEFTRRYEEGELDFEKA